MDLKDFCSKCCLVLSLIGFVLFFYLTLICLFSPDRFDILKYKNEEEDNDNYTKAWSTAAIGCFLYLLIAIAIIMFKYNNDENRNHLRNWL